MVKKGKKKECKSIGQWGLCTFASIHFSFFNPEIKYGKRGFFFNGSNTDEYRISRHKQIFIIQNSDFIKNHKNDMKFVF